MKCSKENAGAEEDANASEYYYSAMSMNDVTRTMDESAKIKTSLASLSDEHDDGTLNKSKSTSNLFINRYNISLINDMQERHVVGGTVTKNVESFLDKGEESLSKLEKIADERNIAVQEMEATNVRQSEISTMDPDQFCEIVEELYKSPDYIDREVYLNLGNNVIALKRGTWIIQRGGDEILAEAQEREGYLTWHLPGYVVVMYSLSGKWFVRMRDSTATDEIKWNLVDVIDALHNSELDHQEQSIIYHLYESVSDFVDKFRYLEKAIFIPKEEKAEALDDLLDLNLGLHIRVRFCTSIASVLARGLKRKSIFKKYHIWDFILSTGIDTNIADKESYLLSRTVRAIDRDVRIGDKNSKFRGFVVAALNTGRLFEWMYMLLLRERSRLQMFYEAKALVLVCPNMIVNAMAPLGDLPFRLSHEKDFRDMVVRQAYKY